MVTWCIPHIYIQPESRGQRKFAVDLLQTPDDQGLRVYIRGIYHITMIHIIHTLISVDTASNWEQR